MQLSDVRPPAPPHIADLPPAPRRRRGIPPQRALIGPLIALALMSVAIVSLGHHYSAGVPRKPLLAPHAPVDWNRGPLNLLLFGGDSAIKDPGTDGGELDTIMLLHFNRALNHATLISIPRRSYVAVPAGANWDGGRTTIDRAAVLGGPVMVARTVGTLTGIDFDGAMVADLNSVNQLVDAVGGIRVCLAGGGTCRKLSGSQAEAFMTDDRGSDANRIHDQQQIVAALAERAAGTGVLMNPLKLNRLLDTVGNALVVDDGLDLAALSRSVRRVRPRDVDYTTVPVASTFETPEGRAERLDPARSAAMFNAVRDDSVTTWLKSQRS